MENIRKAIQDKHAKELQTKKALESAQSAYVNYKEQLMERRKLEHQERQKDFVNKLGE